MYVTDHAQDRIAERVGGEVASALIGTLEVTPGQAGTVAYVLLDLPAYMVAPDGSNGDTLIAVAVDGSVETIYYRRGEQDMSPGYFGASRVEDLRAYPTCHGFGGGSWNS